MKRMIARIIKNIGLMAISFAFAFAAIECACKLYVKIMNIQAPSYLYENKIDMLAPDSLVGYVNKPNFSGICFGNISIRTNSQGFRGTRPVAASKNPGATRIFGLGDSVIWGVGVKQDDTIMGLLEQKLNRDKLYEVINAGGIGYSTYQEVLFFEKFILPFKPDIVMVNFCINDILYSEDPYLNLGGISASYLNTILNHQSLTHDEKINIEKMQALLKSRENPFSGSQSRPGILKQLFGTSDLYSVPGFMKAFLEMPITRLAERCRRENIRLIYLFIPPAMEFAQYKNTVNFLKQLLTEKGAEFIDLQPALKPQTENVIGKKIEIWPFLENRLPHVILQVLEHLNKQRVHKREIFLDWVHPTIKGNEIIAESIYQYLRK